MLTTTSIGGNIHEAAIFVNRFPLFVQHFHQFVQQGPGTVGIVFMTRSREDLAALRKQLGQTMPVTEQVK